MTRYRSILRIACISLAACSIAAAAEAADFYKGKTVSITVGFPPGGGYDGYARFFARSWGNFIPGHPNFIVRNMPGAGSLKAANYIYNAAPKDGTEMAAISQGVIFEPLFRTMGTGHGAKFDATKFGWIGAANREQEVMVVWNTTPFKSIADLRKSTVVTGTTGSTANYGVYPRLMNATMGTRIKIVSGYSGTSDITIALERGEIQAMTGWDYSSLSTVKRDWLLKKKVRVLVQFGAKKLKELPDVPLARNHTTTKVNRDVLDLITVRQDIGRPYVAPAKLPKGRLAMLQNSFQTMVKDKAFLELAKRIHLEINPSTPAECIALIKKVYAAPPDVVAKARKILLPKKKKAKKKKKM